METKKCVLICDALKQLDSLMHLKVVKNIVILIRSEDQAAKKHNVSK